MGIRQLAVFGDSLSNDGMPAYAEEDGGLGGWPEIVAERLATIPGIGPLLSSGFRPVTNGPVNDLASGHEWSYAGSWTDVVATDAFDKLPYGFGKYANGAANIATFTRPTAWRLPVGFALYWIDKTGGGNWQYRIDGGTWTNMGQTILNNNALCKFYVPTAFTSTVEIRASSDATTAVGCFPAGIELFWSDPTAANASGLIVHHLAVTAQNLHGLVAGSTNGDRLAFLDSVRLGTGSPITNVPTTGVVMMHINDVKDFASTATWDTDVTTLHTRVAPLAPLALMSPWEAKPATFNATTQDGYRTHTKTTAASFSPASPVLDFYDIWTALGFGTGIGTQNALIQAAGFLGDNIHETQAGHLDIAPRVYGFLLANLFKIGKAGNIFSVGSSTLGTATALLGGQVETILPDGKAVAVTPGSPTIHATKTIATTGKAVAVTAGTPTLHASNTIAPSGVPVTVTAGSPTIHATTTISATGLAVAVTAGGPLAVVGPGTIPAFGKAVAVTAGTPTILAGPVTLHPTGLAVAVSAGTGTLRAVNTIVASGVAVTITAGTVTTSSHATIHPAAVPVLVVPGTPTFAGGVTEPATATLTVVAHTRASVTVLPGPTATVSV